MGTVGGVRQFHRGHVLRAAEPAFLWAFGAHVLGAVVGSVGAVVGYWVGATGPNGQTESGPFVALGSGILGFLLVYFVAAGCVAAWAIRRRATGAVRLALTLLVWLWLPASLVVGYATSNAILGWAIVVAALGLVLHLDRPPPWVDRTDQIS